MLNGVSCVSASSCKAVGYYVIGGANKTLIESWNGTAWSISSAPAGREGLAGVSCVSAISCMAVGAYDNATLVESWNGTAWRILSSPNSTICIPSIGCASGSYLDGVSCVSAISCIAVGNWVLDYGVLEETFIESWNGSVWSIVSSPNVAGLDGTSDFLNAVSWISASSCKAVGEYWFGSQEVPSLIESWNGTAWTVSSSPSPGSTDELNAVSCISASSCKAVG